MLAGQPSGGPNRAALPLKLAGQSPAILLIEG
jgi:hypothetical protein